jgi:DnaJ-class molecular chaperone
MFVLRLISRFGSHMKFYNKTFKSSISNICYNSNDVPDLTIYQMKIIKSKSKSKKTMLNEKLQYNMYDTDSCKYCHGTGMIVCYECDGFGKLYFDGFKECICDTCRGVGQRGCNMCGGSGVCNRLF